ncbi:hypothetical protein AGR4C_pa50041 [Agrobacterium tumefaciens str. Kerr 14]|uniref:Uncharacterized protein n=2 Tax=Agrobacterium tumefaciens TaxID=358 RepID=A0A1S7SAI2_AGRTU|nr:hypothetical protein AGR4C_pa50041 [Agrobacterium tumefaciens str. Kerr 14]
MFDFEFPTSPVHLTTKFGGKTIGFTFFYASCKLEEIAFGNHDLMFFVCGSSIEDFQRSCRVDRDYFLLAADRYSISNCGGRFQESYAHSRSWTISEVFAVPFKLVMRWSDGLGRPEDVLANPCTSNEILVPEQEQQIGALVLAYFIHLGLFGLKNPASMLELQYRDFRKLDRYAISDIQGATPGRPVVYTIEEENYDKWEGVTVVEGFPDEPP